MKYLILTFLFTISAIGQDLPMELNAKGKLECVRVIDSLDFSSAEIYAKTLEWATMTYQNTKSVIPSEGKNQMIRIQGVSSEPHGDDF